MGFPGIGAKGYGGFPQPGWNPGFRERRNMGSPFSVASSPDGVCGIWDDQSHKTPLLAC